MKRLSFATVNVQLYLLEHPEVWANDEKRFGELMTKTLKLSQGGICASLAAEQILGPELGAAFLAETARDVRHMQLWATQCGNPKTLLLLGDDRVADENRASCPPESPG